MKIVEQDGKIVIVDARGNRVGGPYEDRAAAELDLPQLQKKAAAAVKTDAACTTCKKDCAKEDGCACEGCSCASCSANGCGDEDRDDAAPKLTLGVGRYDTSVLELKPAQLLKNGYLKVDARLTRTGVFRYRNDDGSERRELRLDEEVFKDDSLQTFAMAPITDEHPPVFLNAKNTNEFQRGHMGEIIRRDGKFMVGTGLVTDAKLVEKMQKGRAVQVSCGYTCDLEEKSGVTKDGEKYDAIQRNIRGNHVAIVPLGRAGPDARVRMDSGANVLLSIDPPSEDSPRSANSSERSTVKIKIDGVEYEAGSEQAAAAQVNYQAKLDAKAKEIAAEEEEGTEEEKKKKAFLEQMKAKKDEAEERVVKLDAELKAAPAKIAAEIKARMALEAQAVSVLGPKAKLDGISDRDVKVAVLKKIRPEFKAEGKADAYLDARFDAAIEQFAEEHADEEEGGGVSAARGLVLDENEDGADPGDPSEEMSREDAEKDHKDSGTARDAMVWRGRNEWRQPIGNEK